MMKIKAINESVVIRIKARRPGEEAVSKGGIVMGIEKEGEIPRTGTVISVGANVPKEEIEVGDIVLLPKSYMVNVVDPEVVQKNKDITDSDTQQLVAANWKNIAVVYKQ